MSFLERLHDPRPMLLDGAMGTQLFRLLPGHTGSIELLNLERSDAVARVHTAYADAGADIIETNTFGGSALKLADYGLEAQCAEINRRAAALARSVALSRDIFVAGSMGPCGRLLEPMGDTPVELVYESFRLQAASLAAGGADCIIIETMSDLLEAKTALLAAREACPLPVICSMTFEDSGKTVSGTDVLTGLASLSQCGADAVGMNCSMGPDGLLALYRKNIQHIAGLGVPLTAWANAGLPDIIDGRAFYSLPPERFAEISAQLAGLGVKIVGGCCGTTPEHTAALRRMIDSGAGGDRTAPFRRTFSFLTSRFKSINLRSHEGLLLVGERLNPTARKKFAEDLRAGRNGFLREESRAQEAEGAHLLDINVGVPGIDEARAMRESVSLLSTLVKTPLMIDSDNPEVIETALRLYPGTAIINSISGKKSGIERILPLIKRFGAFAVALCLDESGIHREAGKRIAVGERLLDTLAADGVEADRILVDPLMLAESAEPGAAMETLRVIEHFSSRGIRTSLGISNISFGLPMRKHINNEFLRLAAARGLFAAIANPAGIDLEGPRTEEEQLAHDFLDGSDPGAARYIAHFKKEEGTVSAKAPVSAAQDRIAQIYEMVVGGNNDEIESAVSLALKKHPPEELMLQALIKGLERVGELYSSGEYFLPQMIASANAMKRGFAILRPLLATRAETVLGRVVICTVKGDVHDIGKNIVAMMLENHGFEVTDLGKDVPAETIIAAVKEHNPHILALSSLLTTTMNEMKRISDILRLEELDVKLLVGGAVVTEDYARSIGAYYAQDAVSGVKKARELMG